MEKMENPTFELLNLVKKDCEDFKAELSALELKSLDYGTTDASVFLSIVRNVFENTFGAYMKDYPLVKGDIDGQLNR